MRIINEFSVYLNLSNWPTRGEKIVPSIYIQPVYMVKTRP
jgi:hypothetical protein